MKNMDVFNIESVCLLLLFLLLFKLGFAEYSKKMYIYIKKNKKHKKKLPGVGLWLVSFAVGFCYLVLMVNVPSCLPPELYSIVAALTLRVVMLHFSCC